MLNTLWLLVRIVCVVLVVAWLVHRLMPEPLCHSCKHLVQRGGGTLWKYYCGSRKVGADHFDRPPKYCACYESRDEQKKLEPKPAPTDVPYRVRCKDCYWYNADMGYCRARQCDADVNASCPAGWVQEC